MKLVCCCCAGSLYGRIAPDCAHYLAFDASLTPVKTEYAHKHISRLGSKVRWDVLLLYVAPFFRGKSFCLTLKHIYFPFSPHTRRTLPLIWPLTTGAPVPQPIDSSALNLNLGATESTIKEALCLFEDRLQTKQCLFTFPHFSIHRMNHLSSAVLDFLTIQFMWNACISCV